MAELKFELVAPERLLFSGAVAQVVPVVGLVVLCL